jgi:hypothetical protein
VLLIVTMGTSLAYAASRTAMEAQIMQWAQERLAELEKRNRVGPTAEWQKQIHNTNYEWLAVKRTATPQLV